MHIAAELAYRDSQIDQLRTELEQVKKERDELKKDANTLNLIYDYFLSVKRVGTWFKITQGENEKELAYELSLSLAVDNAIKAAKGEGK